MKGFAENFITPEEAGVLRAILGAEDKHQVALKDIDEDSTAWFVIQRLADHLPDFKIHDESYMRIEVTRKSGHHWHVDTGTNNDMPWCKYGCSIMLSRDYEYVGALFRYRDVDIQPEYCGLLWHDSSEKHMVERHQGVRAVLLIFI